MDDHVRFSGTKYAKGNNNKNGNHYECGENCSKNTWSYPETPTSPMDSGWGTTGGGPGRPPFWRTLEESCKRNDGNPLGWLPLGRTARGRGLGGQKTHIVLRRDPPPNGRRWFY
jgi:hypothetical protein